MYYDLDLIRNNISLVDLAEEAGARFDNPNKLSSHCPLPRHTGDRSSRAFMIYENGRRWKCHSSCPANANSGDIVDFYMAWKNVDFKTAVSELSLRTSLVQGNVQAPIVSKIPVAFPAIPRSPADEWYARAEQFIQWAEYNLAQDIGAQQYLIKERGLSPETCKAFRLGYNPSNTYEDAALWGLDGKKIWLPRGIVIPGFLNGKPSYIKIRRPLPGQLLGNYIGDWAFHDGLPDVKFGGPRGGVTCLFRLELPRHEPVLVLTEGEWDAMLLWEHCPYMCDSGTLGGAGAKLDTLDLLQLSAYPVILVVHDNDEAGDRGRAYISGLQSTIGRIHSIPPPGHDLTDFWRSGGNVERWVASHIANRLPNALQGVNERSAMTGHWVQVARLAENLGRFN